MSKTTNARRAVNEPASSSQKERNPQGTVVQQNWQDGLLGMTGKNYWSYTFGLDFLSWLAGRRVMIAFFYFYLCTTFIEGGIGWDA